MRFYYDLHIHTALSPCGDESMTPNNIVNMSLIKELDIIAITDHNCCGNVASVLKAAEDTGLVVIPGMEVETAEEIHVVCLFPNMEKAKAVEAVVLASLPQIPVNTDIFGAQSFLDSEDDETGTYPYLLVTASSLDLESLIRLVKANEGVAIPAHVDRSSYSILSNLGFIAPDLDVNTIEVSMMTDKEDFLEKNKRLLMRKLKVIQSSDAHMLENINERINYIELDYENEKDDVSIKNAFMKWLYSIS